MELHQSGDDPVPSDPIVSAVRTRDGLSLRVARWSVGDARGTVTLAIGRGEVIEAYFGVVRDLIARRFEVIAFEWRGQGRSDREEGARRRGRWPGFGGASGFKGYGRDLLAVETQVLRVFAPRPWFALGHSMGAALLLEQAHAGTSPFERLVLAAPMIGLPLRRKPGRAAAIRALNAVGLGALPVPDGVHPRARLAAPPSAGAPTVRWLKNALDLTERFDDPRFPVATLLPVLIVAAGADRVVDTAATERFGIRLKAGRCITLPDARHQLLMERPDLAAQFWAAFDAFVPGDATPGPPRTGGLPARPTPHARRGEAWAAASRLVGTAKSLLPKRWLPGR